MSASQPETPLESLKDELDESRFGGACQDEGVDLFVALHALVHHVRKAGIQTDDVCLATLTAVRVIARVRKAAKREVAA